MELMELLAPINSIHGYPHAIKKAPTPERIEAKEPVKSHGGAGGNIHKKGKKKRKNRQ